jgi:Flp pilus assembly protein TadD
VPAVLRVSPLSSFRSLCLAGLATVLLAGCAMNSASTAPLRSPDYSGQNPQQQQANLGQLADRYKADPKDKQTIIYYAAALRAAGQPQQAVAVVEQGLTANPHDVDLQINYAKALSAAGSYGQALNVITDAVQPDNPDWNALLVKGAILDQMGNNADARAAYTQALLIAPNEPSLEANLGLSYAMTNDLPQAEQHLRKAAGMPGSSSKIRQNLALVIGLEGRFDEARALFAAELPPDQVDSNMAYIKSLLTQQNRWAAIKGGEQ